MSEEPAQEGQFTEANKADVLLWLAALQALFDDVDWPQQAEKVC